MIDFVLDDLGRPTGIGFKPGLKLGILVFDFNGPIPLDGPPSVQRKATFLGFVAVRTLYDFGVKHDHVRAFVVKNDDTLANSDHVCCHADAAFRVGSQGIQQVLSNL